MADVNETLEKLIAALKSIRDDKEVDMAKIRAAVLAGLDYLDAKDEEKP